MNIFPDTCPERLKEEASPTEKNAGAEPEEWLNNSPQYSFQIFPAAVPRLLAVISYVCLHFVNLLPQTFPRASLSINPNGTLQHSQLLPRIIAPKFPHH